MWRSGELPSTKKFKPGLRWEHWLPSVARRPKTYEFRAHCRFCHNGGNEVGPLFKRKARLVMCGNFEGRVQEEVYASGFQGESLRAILAVMHTLTLLRALTSATPLSSPLCLPTPCMSLELPRSS